MRVRPIVIVLPSSRVAAGTWWPSTYVPLVELRSRAITPLSVMSISRVLARDARVVDHDVAAGAAA